MFWEFVLGRTGWKMLKRDKEKTNCRLICLDTKCSWCIVRVNLLSRVLEGIIIHYVTWASYFIELNTVNLIAIWPRLLPCLIAICEETLLQTSLWFWSAFCGGVFPFVIFFLMAKQNKLELTKVCRDFFSFFVIF